METTLWAIGIRADQSGQELRRAVEPFAAVDPFKVPASGLRVGTLDSLMSLSDDLAKMDVLAEATVTRMYKQLSDLDPNGEAPTILGGACKGSRSHSAPKRCARVRCAY